MPENDGCMVVRQNFFPIFSFFLAIKLGFLKPIKAVSFFFFSFFQSGARKLMPPWFLFLYCGLGKFHYFYYYFLAMRKLWVLGPYEGHMVSQNLGMKVIWFNQNWV